MSDEHFDTLAGGDQKRGDTVAGFEQWGDELLKGNEPEPQQWVRRIHPEELG